MATKPVRRHTARRKREGAASQAGVREVEAAAGFMAGSGTPDACYGVGKRVFLPAVVLLTIWRAIAILKRRKELTKRCQN